MPTADPAAASARRSGQRRRRRHRPTGRRWRVSGVNSHVVKSRPRTVGRQLWKTMAPVMLPIASVSLPVRTQRTLLNFSGSSVAMGAMISARIVGSSPSRWTRCSTAPTKTWAPMMISPRASSTWLTMIRIRGTAPSISRLACSPGRMSSPAVRSAHARQAGGVQAVEARLGLGSGSSAKWAAHRWRKVTSRPRRSASGATPARPGQRRSPTAMA